MVYNRRMEKKSEEKKKALDSKKRNLIIIATVVIVGLLIFWLTQQNTPRSVAAYCKVYGEEKARLAKLPGDTWPAGIFNDELSDAGEIANSVAKLEKVAPDEIRSDVATIKAIYQKINADPSQAISASLSGVSAEENVKEWTTAHCN